MCKCGKEYNLCRSFIYNYLCNFLGILSTDLTISIQSSSASCISRQCSSAMFEYLEWLLRAAALWSCKRISILVARPLTDNGHVRQKRFPLFQEPVKTRKNQTESKNWKCKFTCCRGGSQTRWCSLGTQEDCLRCRWKWDHERLLDFDQSLVFQLLIKLISIWWKQGQIRSSYKKLPELHCLILIIDVIGARNLFAKKLESNFKQILTSAITSVEQENRYSCWTDSWILKDLIYHYFSQNFGQKYEGVLDCVSIKIKIYLNKN